MNFRYKLMQFLSGRYGVDTLFYFLFGAAAVISFINCFLRSPYLQIVVYAIVIYAFFRILSRNIEKRRRENVFFAELARKARERAVERRTRKADYSHIYRKCPYCKATLRLPRRKGKHTTVCPKCQKSFKVRVFK